jgi:hypothetical protein
VRSASERGARASLWALAAALVMDGGLAVAQGKAPESTEATSSPCTLTAASEKSEVAVGEPFRVVVKGVAPDGAAWTFPREAASETVELRACTVDARPAPPGTSCYDAMAFALGETQVPAIEAQCHLADGSVYVARSAPLTLRMLSVLPKDPQEQKLADIRPPVSLAIGRAFWIALGIALVLLVAGLGVAAYLVFLSVRPQKPWAKAVRPLSPDVEARDALARLGEEDWISRGDYRGYYIALAQIAKRYLERRLAAPVLEMTSSETIAFLRQRESWGESVGVVRDLTTAADQVKFAEASGSSEEAARHLRATADLVDRVEAALRPAASLSKSEAA